LAARKRAAFYLGFWSLFLNLHPPCWSQQFQWRSYCRELFQGNPLSATAPASPKAPAVGALPPASLQSWPSPGAPKKRA